MNSLIKDIVNKDCSKEDKNKELDLILEDISIAKGILYGKYKRCPKCDDYYLTRSYLSETETKETQICVYRDIINSGGNEYEDGYLDITYSICPKGHRYEVSQSERKKR